MPTAVAMHGILGELGAKNLSLLEFLCTCASAYRVHALDAIVMDLGHVSYHCLEPKPLAGR